MQRSVSGGKAPSEKGDTWTGRGRPIPFRSKEPVADDRCVTTDSTGRQIKDGHGPPCGIEAFRAVAAFISSVGFHCCKYVQGTFYLLTNAPKRISKRIS